MCYNATHCINNTFIKIYNLYLSESPRKIVYAGALIPRICTLLILFSNEFFVAWDIINYLSFFIFLYLHLYLHLSLTPSLLIWLMLLSFYLCLFMLCPETPSSLFLLLFFLIDYKYRRKSIIKLSI